MLAGAAYRDITPAKVEGLHLAGFGAGRTATGVLDPIELQALYLKKGAQEVALVTIDCIGVNLPLVEAIRKGVKDLDAQAIIVMATHTHSAPDTIGMWGPAFLGLVPKKSGVDPQWLHLLIQRAIEAIHEARERAVPAYVRAASIEIDKQWTRNDREKGERYDEAVAMAFEDSEGTRIATLLNFASHPEALWNENRLISAEHPGYFRAQMRELHPTGVPLYVSGPLGGMLTPNVPEKSDSDARIAYIKRLGGHLAKACEQALSDAVLESEPELMHRHMSFKLKNANRRFTLLSKLKLIGVRLEQGVIESEVHHLQIGQTEALSAPGEMLPELGHRVRALMKAPHRLLLGLAIDELGYILPEAQYDDRDYRYEKSMSVGRDTAKALLSAHRELLA